MYFQLSNDFGMTQRFRNNIQEGNKDKADKRFLRQPIIAEHGRDYKGQERLQGSGLHIGQPQSY